MLRKEVLGILVLFFVASTGAVRAEPNPIALSGTIADGSVVTLSGTGFGSGSETIPIVFDNFELGVPGTPLSSVVWSITEANGPGLPTYSNEFAVSGQRSGYADMTMGGDSAAFVRGINTDRIYASFRFRFDMNGSPSTQKGFRVHADDGPNVFTSRPAINVQDFATEHRATISSFDDSGDKTTLYGVPDLAENRWYRLEYYFTLSNPAGSRNGTIRVSHDLDTVTNRTDLITRESGVSDNFQLAMLPFYFGNGGGGKIWYDDVYISRSQARVEVGDSASWVNCTERRVQIPVSWSASEIRFRTNLSGFESTDGLFVFVVDENGSISDGIPLGEVVRPEPPRELN